MTMSMLCMLEKRFVCGRTCIDETEASPRRTGTPIIRTAVGLASNHSLGFSELSRLSAASQNIVISVVCKQTHNAKEERLRNFKPQSKVKGLTQAYTDQKPQYVRHKKIP